MNTWILIIMLTGPSGKAVDHVEFIGRQACEQAAEWANKQGFTRAACFPQFK